MVEDAELRMAALAVEVVGAVGLPVEVHSPAHQLAYLRRRAPDHHLHSLGVGEPVARHHRVMDVLVEIVRQKVGYACHAALGEICVGLVEGGLAHDRHPGAAGHLEREAHSGYAGADDEIIILTNHD